MKREEVIKELKRINKELFEHKFIHHRYIIPFKNQTDECLFDSLFSELIEYGEARAQAHYAQKFLDDDFWKPFNTKKHMKECSLCRKYMLGEENNG